MKKEKLLVKEKLEITEVKFDDFDIEEMIEHSDYLGSEIKYKLDKGNTNLRNEIIINFDGDALLINKECSNCYQDDDWSLNINELKDLKLIIDKIIEWDKKNNGESDV